VGLIDRAFGADKNTMLMHRLALHWRMVASHYENFLKKNELNEQDRVLMAEIQKRSLSICDKAEASIKGFGVVNMEKESFLLEMRELGALHQKISVITDKHIWLPDAIRATSNILNGNKRDYQNRQYWFSD
jgi:hypothetical protein